MIISFVCNHHKTLFYIAIAKQLELKGHTIYWISPSRSLTSCLINHNIPRANILDVSSYGSSWNSIIPLSVEERQYISSYEIPSLTYNNILLIDRNLRYKNPNYSLRYLYIATELMSDFIVNFNIEFLFCEQTWGIEIIAGLVAKRLGAKCLRPHTVRIPDGRFSFFETPYEDIIYGDYTSYERDDIIDSKVESFYDNFIANKIKPSYFYRNNDAPTLHINWFFKTLKHIFLSYFDKYDETRFSLLWLIVNRPKYVINAIFSTKFNIFSKVSLPTNTPYVLYTLHKQPEYSIDVLGSYYSNQFELIKLISKAIPSTHHLYVKEHSNALGDRSIFFFNNLLKLPNVILVDPFTDSYDLINHADLIITVSGTIAYEAALLGKKSITLSNMFFNSILSCNIDYNIAIEQRIFQALCEPSIADIRQKAICFLKWLFHHSFNGKIGDPVSDPTVLSEENINAVVNAFQAVLGTTKEIPE